MSDLLRSAKEEKLRRLMARAALNPRKVCHPKQAEYVLSPDRRNVVTCSRRAGKTFGEAVRLLLTAHTEPYANVLYATTELRRSRRLVWPYLQTLNSNLRLGGIPNETEAFMRFPNLPQCPTIFLGGAKDAGEIEKIKGYAGGFKLAIIDEAQDFRPASLRLLIEEAIEPSLMDWSGSLDALGTPGAVRHGPYWDLWQSPLWRKFHWSLADNKPLLEKAGKTAEEILRQARADHGWDENDPTYLRHYLGQWCDDPNALVIRYDELRNHYDAPPRLDKYVMGVDLGHYDSDAVAVLGWGDHSPDVYLVAEYGVRKESYTELVERGVLPLLKRYQPCIAQWWDFGGMNAKAQQEIRKRWGLPVQAAEKSRKLEHIALLNDALRTGRFRAKRDSWFAQDSFLLQWETPHEKVDDSFHSDIIDAVLYAYRAALGYTSRPAPEPLTEPQRIWAERRERLQRDPVDEIARLVGID